MGWWKHKYEYGLYKNYTRSLFQCNNNRTYFFTHLNKDKQFDTILPLDITNLHTKSINEYVEQNLMGKYDDETVLISDKCGNINTNHANAKHHKTFYSFNKYIIIQLKFTLINGIKHKINKNYEIHPYLNISNYDQTDLLKPEPTINKDSKGSPQKYKLIGYVAHRGNSADSGHYVFINIKIIMNVYCLMMNK